MREVKIVSTKGDAERYFSWMVEVFGGGCMSRWDDYIGATYTSWGVDDGVVDTLDGGSTTGVPSSLFIDREGVRREK
jgi:hypothetical protein